MRLGSGTIQRQDDPVDFRRTLQFITPFHAIGIELNHQSHLACARAEPQQITSPKQGFPASKNYASISMAGREFHELTRLGFRKGCKP
jgi:hypothetical protein